MLLLVSASGGVKILPLLLITFFEKKVFLQNFLWNLESLVRLKAQKPGFISVLLHSTDSSRSSKISVGSDCQYNPTLIFTGITK